MPPFLRMFASRSVEARDVSSELHKQWTNPGDVFSVLLILGGDVVARALAQSTGWLIGPPSFSFGWVAYSINALVAAVGENKLMPEPDCNCLVINGKSGYARDNKSWILGRLVRDYDFWMHKDVRDKVNGIIDTRWAELKSEAKAKKWAEPQRPAQVGLCVSIYQPEKPATVAQAADRWLWVQSIAVAVVQLGIAAIPCGTSTSWAILLITACGIVLSSTTASLPQWRKEKWACRRQYPGKEKAVVLTRGNGSQHAIVVLGGEAFLDLEDLATGQTDVTASTSTGTRIAVAVLALFWLLLLITASGLSDHTWFLLAVGGIGILFNVYVAGKQRDPRSNGLPLKFVDVVAHSKGMEALYQIEETYPRLGASMLDTFFPGKLRPDEEQKWNAYEKSTAATMVTGQGIS